jgi:HSP20 family protein
MNIIRRQEPTTDMPMVTRWDPFRMMREMMRWDPYRELSPMFSMEEWKGVFTPDVDVKETPNAYVFKADVPGMKEKDIEISLTGNRLILSGKREESAARRRTPTSPPSARMARSPARSRCRWAPTRSGRSRI